MATMTLKNVPESLVRDLKRMASAKRRSLNQHVIYLLEQSVKKDPHRTLTRREVEERTKAWEAAAGKWKSDLTAAEEIAMIYQGRRGPGPVDP